MSKMSISVVKGKGSIAHNNRDFVTENVDKNKTSDNITYKTEPIDQAYKILFAEEVERYNVGKKPCRQISNYMDHIRLSKNGEKLFYETVVQVGNKFDCPIGSEMGEKVKSVLDAYMKEFQKRNPNLYVFNAVMHLDESTPHLHIDYIPVAHGYNKGLQVRNSLDKALKEQGIEGKANKKDNSTHNWQNGEKDHIEGIMREYGLERSSEKGLHREHMSIDQYKGIAEQIHNEVKQIDKHIDATPLFLNKKRVSVEKDELKKLEHRAKLSLLHEKATKKLVVDIKKDFKEIHQYNQYTKENTLQLQHDAKIRLQKVEVERKKAVYMHEKADKLYNQQINLNDSYNELYITSQNQKKTIKELQTLNLSLRGQIDDLRQLIEQRVQESTKPLKNQIQAFEDKIKDIATITTSVTKAISYIDKQFNSDNLHKICDAVKNYTKIWLNKDGFHDMAQEVDTPELSKEILKCLMPEPEAYKEIIFRKGESGYGFYAANKEGGQFLGEKKDYDALKKTFSEAKFKDPFEYIPQISGYSKTL